MMQANEMKRITGEVLGPFASELLLKRISAVLDEAPDNQPVSWENPKTRNRGEMTVLKSFESKGRPCKEVRVRNEARGRKSDNRSTLCKVDERWRLVGSSQLKGK